MPPSESDDPSGHTSGRRSPKLKNGVHIDVMYHDVSTSCTPHRCAYLTCRTGQFVDCFIVYVIDCYGCPLSYLLSATISMFQGN